MSGWCQLPYVTGAPVYPALLTGGSLQQLGLRDYLEPFFILVRLCGLYEPNTRGEAVQRWTLPPAGPWWLRPPAPTSDRQGGDQGGTETLRRDLGGEDLGSDDLEDVVPDHTAVWSASPICCAGRRPTTLSPTPMHGPCHAWHEARLRTPRRPTLRSSGSLLALSSRAWPGAAQALRLSLMEDQLTGHESDVAARVLPRLRRHARSPVVSADLRERALARIETRRRQAGGQPFLGGISATRRRRSCCAALGNFWPGFASYHPIPPTSLAAALAPSPWPSAVIASDARFAGRRSRRSGALSGRAGRALRVISGELRGC